MKAKLKSRRVWLIAAVAVVFGVSLWLAWTPQLSEMERLEREAIMARRKSTQLFRKEIRSSPGLWMDWLFGKATVQNYSTVFHEAESNLVVKGYYVRTEIEFKHGDKARKAFQLWAMTHRTNDGIWSCMRVTNSTIQLFVRSNSLPAWEALVREFDQSAAK